MSEKPIHPNHRREETACEPITSDSITCEDPGIASHTVPTEPTTEQSTVILQGDERRRSLRARACRLRGEPPGTAQTRGERAPRAWIGARAIPAIAVCLAVALAASVIANRSKDARGRGDQPAGASCASSRRPPDRRSHPHGPVVSAHPAPASTPYRAREHRSPAATVTGREPRSAAATVPPPSAVSEPVSTPTASAPQAPPGAPGQAEEHYDGGPFSP
jgi:hypothetical protein